MSIVYQIINGTHLITTWYFKENYKVLFYFYISEHIISRMIVNLVYFKMIQKVTLISIQDILVISVKDSTTELNSVLYFF